MLLLLRLATLICLLATLSISIFAQQTHPKFEQLTIDDGLSSNTINSIVEDKQGYLWFATADGLNRFDGYKFYTLKHKSDKPNTLSSNYITHLALDRFNNIWISTNGGGVNKYNTTTEEITVFRNGSDPKTNIYSDSINRAYIDNLDRVWVATSGEGLSCINPNGLITHFTNDPNNSTSISNNHVTTLLQDNKNRLWMGTSNGLNLFDEKTNSFKQYYPASTDFRGAGDNTITNIIQTSDGIIWISTSYGLSKFSEANNSFIKYPSPQLAYDNKAKRGYYKIVSDRLGLIWIAAGKDLLCFNPKTESFISYYKDDPFKSNLNSNWIKEVFFDSEGRMWLGTTDGGVNKFDPALKRFSAIQNIKNEPKIISDNSILAICEDSSQTLWVGTLQGLNSYKFTDQSISHINLKLTSELSKDIIRSIFQSSSGLLWIATSKGIIIYDIKKEKVVTKELKLPIEIENILAQRFLEDSKGQIWIGGLTSGLYRVDLISKTFTTYQKDDKNPEGKISSSRITSLFEDKQGNIWVATRNGLNFYDQVKDTFIVYKHDRSDPTSISSNFVNSIYSDNSDFLWIGTDDGLNKLDLLSKKFLRINDTNSTLPNNIVYGVLGDEQGYIWLSTNKGISKYDPKTNKFWNYDKSDGLQSNEFNYQAYFKSKNGELFFGGVNGFNRFYPSQIKNPSYIPKIVITSLKVSDGSSKTLLERNAIAPDYYLELPYNLNFLLFTFSSLNFTHSEKNQYKYILEGQDKEWIVSESKDRSARCPNLGPGDYIFRVIGSNNNDLWNNEGISVRIRILPPWWRTNWAYFLYFLALSSTVYGSHRYHLRRLEKRNQELEIKVEERTEEINNKNKLLENKNQQLAKNYEELLLLNQKANRIFAALSEALPGTVLDNKYRLDEKIGSGGFGAVYKATHLTIKRDVAVKVFSPSPGNDSVENLERFQQEAISTCRVNHPNAVAVLDSGISSEGIPYLVMEMLQGQTLKTELRYNGRLSLERTAEITIPICKVLAKAHSSGLIHRDIKPDNIFLHNNTEGEVVKVLDFGIAKLINSTDSGQNNFQTEGLIGTPLYMAPERLALNPYEAPSDVYSLGSVIYEMLCGQAPFQKHANSLSTIMVAQLSETPVSLKTYLPTISDKIDNLVLATLEKDPQNRPTLTEIAQTFALAAGIEYKTQANIEDKQANKPSLDAIFDQATLLVANKAKSATDEISPSEQITLYNLEHATLLKPKKEN